MKRISSILMILVLTFAFTFALPQKEAEAMVWAGAVPAGITVGAGVYTVGALALAGVVGVAGYDTYSEEINAHALQTWSNGTDLAKQSLNVMIDATKGLGNSMTALDANFQTWLESAIDNIAGGTQNIINSAVIEGNMQLKQRSSTTKTLTSTDPTKAFLVNGSLYATLAIEKGSMWFYVRAEGLLAGQPVSDTFAYPETNIQTSSTQVIAYAEKVYAATTPTEMMSLINATSIGIGTVYGDVSTLKNLYNDGISKTREAWESMRDAGLVLPVDNVIPTYQGNAVNYNEQTDVYTGVDGGVITKGDLTWSFPQPRIRTGEELDVTVPPGVYVDNPAGVYSPSLPTTAIPDIAVPTTTNITTGVTTEIPKTGTGEPPPTGGTTPKGEPVNPFNAKPIPIAALTGLFQLLAALIFYLIRMFTFIATIAFIQPTPIDNPYFLWFIDATFYGIKPFPLVQNLALFFLGFSVYKSVRRVFG